jgi:hypothetical protein
MTVIWGEGKASQVLQVWEVLLKLLKNDNLR